MNWTNDFLGAIFFASSSLAILGGGLVALWHFVLQKPFGAAWDIVLPSECRVRLMPDGGYMYHVAFEMVNLSLLSQRPMRQWAVLCFPGEPGFVAPLPPIKTPEDATQQMGESSSTHESSVSPGERRPFGRTQTCPDLHHAVRLKLAFETQGRRWFGVSVGRNPVMKFGSSFVPVNTEDIRLYSEDLK